MVDTMAGCNGKVMIVWWAILFSSVCFCHGNIARAVGEGGREKRSSASVTAVPGLSAVYQVPRYSPLSPPIPDIACVLDDAQDTLLTKLVPPHLSNPKFDERGDGMQKVKWNGRLKGEIARGAVCRVADAPLYPVAFPLLSWKARLVPEHLSYTISAGEDLRAKLRNAKPHGKVWWQQEPIQPGGWKQATLSDKTELVIPAATLNGSGFYSFVDERDVSDTTVLGTLSLQIRDCPAQRYGDDCQGWCPDCMRGGVCHPRTGKCVCPEGLMGPHCEFACEKGTSGVDCSVMAMNMPGSHICRPSPIPCRCVPGYTGSECRTPCTEDRWGGGCSQDCRLHCVGGCDSETGECDDLGPSPCAGGDAGLPRLRQAPKVTNIGAEHATVEFSKWTEDYDDGDAALWNNLTYAVKLKTSNSADTFTATSSKPRYILKNLKPGTKYEVQVVLVVTAAGGTLTCTADGTGRERVHTVFFTTTCPEGTAHCLH